MNLYEKINMIMSEVKNLQKDGKLAFGTTKYNFLSEAKTTSIFHDLFVKYKIVLLPVKVIEEKQGNVTIGNYTYKMINCEKPEEFIELQSGGQGQDSSDKGSGKSSSYAYKYLLWRTFAIPSNDDPDQFSSDENVEKEAKLQKEKELKRLKEIIEAKKEFAKVLSDSGSSKEEIKNIASIRFKLDDSCTAEDIRDATNTIREELKNTPVDEKEEVPFKYHQI